MTNALGIAAVTAVLQDLLNNRLVDASVGDVSVSAVPPDRIKTDSTEPTQLNLFLYQVTPNQGWRNNGLPSRAGDGTTELANPPLALDLHYLLTAYSAQELKAEILLGYAMQVLHETPVLTRQMIKDKFAAHPTAVTGGDLPPPLDTLSAAELADQVELVKLTPQAFATEELSRLWAALGANYRPTAGYQASVLLIEGTRSTKTALPVAQRKVYVRTFREPVIERVEAEGGGPIVAGSKLVLLGQRLVGEATEVLVSGMAATIDGASDTRILATPPPLRAGVQAAQVQHPIGMGDPEVPHHGFESNIAPYVLRPTFGGWALSPAPAGSAPYAGKVTLTMAPAVAAGQRVTLVLNSTTSAQAYTFRASPRTADGDPVEVPLENVARDEYFVRVQVDGAESPIDLDPASVAFGPTETV